MLIVSPLAGRLSNRVGSRLVLVWGTAVGVAAYTVLALAHEAPWQILLTMSLTGTGLALAFSAMATLIVTAVPVEQTGVAAGMNTIMRTIGGAFGSQIGTSLAVAFALPSGAPRELGFTIAFCMFLAVGVVAWLAAMAVPRAAG
jgi:MFS family permease